METSTITCPNCGQRRGRLRLRLRPVLMTAGTPLLGLLPLLLVIPALYKWFAVERKDA